MAASTRFIEAIVRRGLELVPGHLLQKRDKPPTEIHLSSLAVVVFLVTGAVFLAAIFAIEYTYGAVITVLTVIEDPNPETSAPLPSYTDAVGETATISKPPNASVIEADEGLMPVYTPITSRFRTTIRHLQARAGPWSRFRGLPIFLVTSVLRIVLINMLFFLKLFAPVLAELAVATMYLAWVHIVISAPTSKPWYKRIPSIRGNWLKIAPAVAVSGLAAQVSLWIPILLGSSLSAFHMGKDGLEWNSPDKTKAALTGVLALFVSLALIVLVDIPANVILVRVAASLLPAEDETIVPFDRTFGGKVTPTEAPGSGHIGVVDAWKSFSWASYRRLMVNIAKVFGMLVALGAVFGAIFGVQIYVFMGDALKKAAAGQQ